MTQFTSAELISMGRHIPTPFSINISTEQGEAEMKISSLLRVVPGRRLVALSSWKNRTVIVKIFLSNGRWKQNMLKDIAGINQLRQARIPTPKLLLQTTTADSSAGVMLIDYLHDGVSLATLFDNATDKTSKAKIAQMGVKAIGDCHRAGLYQDDVHLDNFMLSAGVTYVLDGGDIKDKLDVAKRRDNLAAFLAQFPAAQDKSWREAIDAYGNGASELFEGDINEFPSRVVAARRKRLSTYERKLTRSTTANRCEQGRDFFYIYDRSLHSPDLERFIDEPDSFIDEQRLLKDGNSSTVALVKINERNFVLKRYNIKSFWHGISRAFRPSRAQNSWRSASVLQMLGVATAQPFLFLEERAFWFLRKRAYFLCEYIESSDLRTAWENQELEASEEHLVALFRDLFKTMAEYQISHGDMKATNFLIKQNKVYVLDLDAMTRTESREKFKDMFSKDMKRFQKNWEGTSMAPHIETLLTEVAKF